ncbi:fibronectin type III domain-containing protein [Eggerthellaceae bacterium 24-137]
MIKTTRRLICTTLAAALAIALVSTGVLSGKQQAWAEEAGQSPATPQQTSISKAGMGVKYTSLAYNGKTQKPSVAVKLNGKTLRNGTDYTVSYKNNKNVGTATVTVTGKGAYTGTKTATFKIVPKGTSISKLAKGKKAFTVKWKALSKTALKQATGYQVRWSTAKSMKGAKSKTVKATSSGGKKRQLTVSKLKAGKKYYVQVRTYKKVGGKTYYSSWSKAKTVTTIVEKTASTSKSKWTSSLTKQYLNYFNSAWNFYNAAIRDYKLAASLYTDRYRYGSFRDALSDLKSCRYYLVSAQRIAKKCSTIKGSGTSLQAELTSAATALEGLGYYDNMTTGNYLSYAIEMGEQMESCGKHLTQAKKLNESLS